MTLLAVGVLTGWAVGSTLAALWYRRRWVESTIRARRSRTAAISALQLLHEQRLRQTNGSHTR